MRKVFFSSHSFLLWFLVFAAVIAITGRIIPHIPNFTPVGALALFAGVYLVKKSKWALLLPLGAMFLSDLFIGFYDLKLMAVVYASFLAYTGLGMLVSKRVSTPAVLLGSMGGATVFYLTTNFAVWLFSSWYPHTVSGLLLSYTLALPFFKYTLLGDLFFTSVLFGIYELAVHLLHQRELKLGLAELSTSYPHLNSVKF